jgi:DNA-binding FrmR family transcriptional regulator/YHS domain-containing protein
MKPEYKREAALRLKMAAGHLDSVRRMVDHDAYCIDPMKQLSAVQASLERVQQIFLRNHLSTCVSDAIKEGMGGGVGYALDPVCGMQVQTASAPATARHVGHTYYFCRDRCRGCFVQDAQRFVKPGARLEGMPPGEAHEIVADSVCGHGQRQEGGGG